jgi:hypothetical protein
LVALGIAGDHVVGGFVLEGVVGAGLGVLDYGFVELMVAKGLAALVVVVPLLFDGGVVGAVYDMGADGLTQLVRELPRGKKEEAGQVVPPPQIPFRGYPASLTEGG